jgi:flagellar hook-associated protein 2
LSIGGLATGLDTNSIVDQLVALEKSTKVDLLTAQQSQVQSQQTALQTFNTKLVDVLAAVDKLRDAGSAISQTATSSNTSTLTAVAGDGALKGSTDITVNSLARGAIAVSANGKSATDATIATGDGSFSFKVGTGDTQTVAISATTTLSSLSDSINALGAGVTASVVNLGTSATPDYRLRLASSGTGVSNDIAITQDDTSLGVAVTQNAQNASISVTGFATPFSRESNVVSDVIPGVTLTLLQKGTATVTSDTDTAAVASKVQDVANAYNALVSFVNQQSTVTQDTTSTEGTVSAGPLAFDSTVKSLLSGLHDALSNPVGGLSGSFSLLAEIGVTSNKDGTLTFDSSKLTEALSTNEGDVATLFTGSGTTGGVFDRLHDYLTGVTGPNGPLATHSNALGDQITSLQSRIDDGQRSVDAYQANLKAQFTNLELLVSSLKSQSGLLGA